MSASGGGRAAPCPCVGCRHRRGLPQASPRSAAPAAQCLGLFYDGPPPLRPAGARRQLRLQADAARPDRAHGAALRGCSDQYRDPGAGPSAPRPRGRGPGAALPEKSRQADRGEHPRRDPRLCRAAGIPRGDAQGGARGVTPEISIVIPAFNEALRLPATLDRVERHLATINASAEVIVVDDGSRDSTEQVVRERAARWPQLSLIVAERNGGKGGAVRLGMAAARGRYRIFSDADLSVPIDDMEKLLRPLRAGAGVAIASRGLRDSQVELHQPWYRETMGKIFNRLVRIFVFGGVKDTQCGFKAFTAEVADRVFPELQTRGFGFDVEVLYRAQQAGYKIVEIPTRWINSPQSRVHPIRDSTMMFLELLAIPGRVRKHPTPAAKHDQRQASA